VVAHGSAFEWAFVYQKFGITLDNLVDTLLLVRLAACGDMSVDAGLVICSQLPRRKSP